MIQLTRMEAIHILDTLKEARDDAGLEESDFEEAIEIMEAVLEQDDVQIESGD